MYKVFIENRLLLLKESVSEGEKCICFHYTELPRTYDDLVDFVRQYEPFIDLVVFGKSDQKLFDYFFQSLDFVQAAGGIVQNGDKFLMIRRFNQWDLPKGKIEVGEVPESAAAREILEECGLDWPKFETKITTTFHTYYYEGVPTIKKTYWYYFTSEDNKSLKPQLEEGITEVVWISYDQLLSMGKETYYTIREVIDQFSMIYDSSN